MGQLNTVLVCLLLAGLAWAPLPLQRTQAPVARPTAFPLTVDSIMRGPKLVGYPPYGLRWSGDSRDLYFEWRQPGEDEPATYVVSREGSSARRLTDEERKQAPPPAGVWDSAHRRVLFVEDGDIVLVDSVSRRRYSVTRTSAAEGNPRWARQDTHVTFRRDNNLFIVPVAAAGEDDKPGSGLIVQLTDVGIKPAEPKLTESQKFLKEEERKLLESVRRAADKKEKDEAKKKAESLPRVDISDGQTAVDLVLSPDESFVYLLVQDEAKGAKRAGVPNYVTQSSYPELIPARTNVGDLQDRTRLGILNLRTRAFVWGSAPFAEKTSDAPPATGQDDKKKEAQAPSLMWSLPLFSKDGTQNVAMVWSPDNKNQWIVRVDPLTGEARLIDHAHDAAWVRQMGSEPTSAMGWMPDNRALWFLSERSGWMHVYQTDATADSPKAEPLTSGKFEVSAVELSRDGKTFYLTTNEAHPGEQQIYRMDAKGGQRTRLTSMTGAHSAEVSPDGSMLGLVYSYTNKPPDVYLMANEPGAMARQITTSSSEEWRSFRWADPQIVTYKARDGAVVYARLYTPEMVGAKRDPSAPGIVFVHGAGYLQNAHKYWSYYYREYMFHHLLASRGYVVLDPDYRASAGYGRDWRTAIYRHMGGKDLEDVIDGAGFLVDRHRVNPKRIGVYGGSYGGFITLMAMFTSPDTFAAGAALRPVTDWAHYNHPYTSNILNEPHDDPEAYRRSSPIYFAEGLKGALLICHGMVDTNVHYQDSVRLAQRLIELRKENWELAGYPVENHAFEEETSWADEYRRVLKLFEAHVRVPNGRNANQGAS